MEIKVIATEKYTTLAPQGELDASSSHYMDNKINEALENGQANLHIECSGLEYISSAGLGVFIHHLLLFMIESYKLSEIGTVMVRTTVSSIFTSKRQTVHNVQAWPK